ncbi:MAG: tRNA lysidine(34) synthetase TilS [Ferruginibacter sp.]
MSIETAFKNYIRANDLFHAKDHLLIAVSGGVDSVVLCELCSRAGYNFSVAHCNFQLRGQESEEDAAFVRSVAARYNVPFFIQQFNTTEYAEQHKLSVQVAARELRYNWFRQLLANPEHGLTHLLTAHHADDNMETIAMNFFKGSGINGLKGILPKQQNIIRPLLFAEKESVLAFADENNLSYREDSSNSSDKYTRNYFRNQLLPAVEKVFPAVKENLLNNAARFKEINAIYQSAVEKIVQKLAVKKENEIHLPVLKLQKTTGVSAVLYEIIKAYGFTAHQVNDVMQLLNAETGRYVSSATHRIFRNRNWLILHPLNEGQAAHYIVEATDEQVNFPLGIIKISKGNEQNISADASVALLDAKNIRFPLILRKWKTGDYFYPLGMAKKKKISRFLIDQKIPLHHKENTWVLESDKRIVWIVGLRMDDRFKITPQTSETVSLRWFPSGQTS